MKKLFLYIIIICTLISCDEDFLERHPLAQPTSETFWTSEDNAKMWVNYLYNSLPDAESVIRDTWSDDGLYRTTTGHERFIANGTHQSTTNSISGEWSYQTIRRCLEFFDFVELIPNISENRKMQLLGQVKFIIAFEYFELITLFRDVPFVTHPLTIAESDIPKSPKSEILAYILGQLDEAIGMLPLTWSSVDNGRASKGAALALKARVLLYNERWNEAAATAKQLMDLNIYELHPKFGELFLKSFNNKTKEVILSFQYAPTVRQHSIYQKFDIISNGGFSTHLPLPDIANSFEDKDGFPINESQLFDINNPFINRDPRFYETFIYPFQTFIGYYFNPLEGANASNSLSYLHIRKYINDKKPGETHSFVNWIIFRYAEVLLTYAEAKNEASGPENSIYEALDLIRKRAGMPVVNREKYNSKEKLREFIRNERRIELAFEGLRYFDIIRWRIAEVVLNKVVTSAVIPGVLPQNNIETRVFDPKKHYVWPIPQSAIDQAKNLEQHPEWK
jgi:starch-binding outer membrane protein, SusD/RagB family